jgi:hypothetical protein
MSSSNRPAIAAEIQAALVQHGTLTSSELTDCCPSADDREVVSKVIYQLKQSGVIEKAGTVPGAPGRGAKQVSQWRLSSLEYTKEKSMPSVHMKFPVSPPCDEPLPAEKAAMLNGTWTEDNPFGTPQPSLGGKTGSQYHDPEELLATPPDDNQDTGHPSDYPATDPTEEALSDLVDQADEAVLAMADSLLSDHPVWSRMRQLQTDAFQALCDWRVRSYLESFENQEPKK